MSKPTLYVAAACVSAWCVLAWTGAHAATFRAETHSRGYVIYSTFDKPERCEVNVPFTFMHDGSRQPGESLCLMKPVPEGKDVKFCEFSHERMVDPIISGPLRPKCLPLE